MEAVYRKYEVRSQQFRVGIGDAVYADTVIGTHHATGEPVRANFVGQVGAIYFNPMHDSFMVLAVAERRDSGELNG
jgi:hypothetical protein